MCHHKTNAEHHFFAFNIIFILVLRNRTLLSVWFFEATDSVKWSCWSAWRQAAFLSSWLTLMFCHSSMFLNGRGSFCVSWRLFSEQLKWFWWVKNMVLWLINWWRNYCSSNTHLNGLINESDFYKCCFPISRNSVLLWSWANSNYRGWWVTWERFQKSRSMKWEGRCSSITRIIWAPWKRLPWRHLGSSTTESSLTLLPHMRNGMMLRY